MMLTSAVRGVVVISINLFNFIFVGGIHCIGSCSGVNSVCCGSAIAHHFHTYHYHYHHHHHNPNHHHNHRLHNQLHHQLYHTPYTSNDGGISDIGWFVMMVVVMVRYLGCWWYSDVDGGDDSCCNGGSCN